MSNRIRLIATFFVSVAFLAIYHGYLSVLAKVGQPPTSGTVLITKLVWVVFALQVIVAAADIRGMEICKTIRGIFPTAILAGLAGAIYLQWFMISVKGSLW